MENGEPSQPPNTGMQVRIWGARGSVPTPSAANLRVGGNTSCVQVKTAAGESFIFDAGTGIRNLGLAHGAEIDKQRDLHIFLTHFHWDHVQGLPFFVPLYAAENTVTFHSWCAAEHLRQVLSGQMTNPYFPVRFDLLAAQMNFAQLVGRQRFGSAKIEAFPLHHPGGCSGYIIEADGARVVYSTDHEHGDAKADAGVCQAATGADLLIYDSQFTPEEYPSHKGWGHSTWLEATRVAATAGVKELLLFHHDPGHTDEQMEEIVELARREFPNTRLAVEGTTVDVAGQAVAAG